MNVLLISGIVVACLTHAQPAHDNAHQHRQKQFRQQLLQTMLTAAASLLSAELHKHQQYYFLT
jgi:hypothetical protein